jgi:hypothetical protein
MDRRRQMLTLRVPEIRLRVRTKDLPRVADERRDVDERVRGSIHGGIEVRCTSHNRAGHDVDLQLGRELAVLLHVVVGAGRDLKEFGILWGPGCEVILGEDGEGGTIFCALANVCLGGCEVGFWIQGLLGVSVRVWGV